MIELEFRRGGVVEEEEAKKKEGGESVANHAKANRKIRPPSLLSSIHVNGFYMVIRSARFVSLLLLIE